VDIAINFYAYAILGYSENQVNKMVINAKE